MLLIYFLLDDWQLNRLKDSIWRLLFQTLSGFFIVLAHSKPTSLCSYSLMLRAEKHQIPILQSGLTRPGLKRTIYRTRGQHANYYTTYAVVLNTKPHFSPTKTTTSIHFACGIMHSLHYKIQFHKHKKDQRSGVW